MNKWRLLLLSVLSLLQSASAERNFVDGRDRYRLDTRLSIQDPRRIHKPLPEQRQLNALSDLHYQVRDVELNTAPSIRHFKNRELHWRSPSVKNNELLSNHRRTTEAERSGANAQTDRRGFRQRNNLHNEDTKVDDRRNRIVKENGDPDNYSPLMRGDFKENRRGHIEPNPCDRVHYTRTEAEHGVNDRRARLSNIAHVWNGRALSGKRFLKRELVNTIYEEPEFKRRLTKRFDSTNNFEKTNSKIHNDILSTRDSLKNENTREMEASRFKILRRHAPRYGATCNEAKTNLQRNSVVIGNNKKDSMREKRSIDSRLTLAVQLFRENHERIKIRQMSDSTYTRDNKNEFNQLRTDKSRRNFQILSNSKSRDNLNTFSRNIFDDRQKRNQKEIWENIQVNSLQDRSLKMCTVRTANTRYVGQSNENNRQCSSRNLPTEERIIVGVHNARNRKDRLTNTRRDTIFPKSNAEKDRYQTLSKGGKVSNEIQRNTNTREERLQNVRRISLSRETRQSTPKLNEIQRSGENSEEIRQLRSRSFSTGEKVSNEIQHVRNAREERNANEVERNRNAQNNREASLINTRHIRSLAMERQQIHADKRSTENTDQDKSRSLSREKRSTHELRNTKKNPEQGTLTRKREYSLARGRQQSMRLLYFHQRTMSEAKDMRRNGYRSLSNEEKVEREHQTIKNTRDERLITNTRRDDLLSSERQYSISKIPATVKLIQNTEKVSRHSFRRSGERVIINEIQNARNTRAEKLRNTRRIAPLTKERLLSTHKLYHNIRSTPNTPEIPHHISQSLSTGDRTTNEIQRARNAQEKSLLNTRRLITEGRHSTSKLILNKRSKNDIENFQRATGERLTNEIRHIRNARETRTTIVIRHASDFREERGTNEIQRTRNTREKRATIEIQRTLKTREERTTNVIRHARDVGEERAKLEIQRTRNTRDERETIDNQRILKTREERTTIVIRHARDVREERATHEIVHAPNVQEMFSNLQHLSPLTRNSRQSIPERHANIRSIENIRRENSRSLFTGKRDINELRHTRNAREERATIENQRTLKTREERATNVIRNSRDVREESTRNEVQRNSISREERTAKEIQRTRNTKEARLSNTRRVMLLAKDLVRKESARNEVQRNSISREEKTANEIQRTRNTKERLSNTRRVMLLAEDIIRATKRIVRKPIRIMDADEIRKYGHHSTHTGERVLDERQVIRNDIRNRNIRDASMFRDQKRSTLQFSASPIPVPNAEIDSTFVLKWQYLFYIFQGIYLSSMFMKNCKENGELKKTRAADWFTMMDYLKIY